MDNMEKYSLLGKKTYNNTQIIDNKIRKIVRFPEASADINLVGLLIGPKGSYLKKLEQQTNCKIYLRGKGTSTNEIGSKELDNEHPYAIIVGMDEMDVKKGQMLIERILNGDCKLKDQIRCEQRKASEIIHTSELELNEKMSGSFRADTNNNLHLVSPYGIPSKTAKVFQVPNECVGLLIGKSGETIKKLIKETGVKILIAIKEIPGTQLRNIFLEGENYSQAQMLIEEMVSHHQKVRLNPQHTGDANPFAGPYLVLVVPEDYLGLILGKSGETVKKLYEETNCSLFIPTKPRPYFKFIIHIINAIEKNSNSTEETFYANISNLQDDHDTLSNLDDKEKEVDLTDIERYETYINGLDEKVSSNNGKINLQKIKLIERVRLLANYNVYEVRATRTNMKSAARRSRIVELSGNNESIEKCIYKIQEIIVRNYFKYRINMRKGF